MGWGNGDNDSVETQVCSSCNGQGSIVQYKTDRDGNEIPTTEACGACGGNGMVQGISR